MYRIFHPFVNFVRVIRSQVTICRRGRTIKSGVRYLVLCLTNGPSDPILNCAGVTFRSNGIYVIRLAEVIRVIQVGNNANGAKRVKNSASYVEGVIAGGVISVISELRRSSLPPDDFREINGLRSFVFMDSNVRHRFQRVMAFTNIAASDEWCVIFTARYHVVLETDVLRPCVVLSYCFSAFR